MTEEKKSTFLFRIPQQGILFWVGILLLISFVVYKFHRATQLSFNHPLQSTVVVDASSSAIPIRIVIDKVKLDLPIYPTTIQGNTWQIDERGISYLADSAQPGQKGSIILYGHNTNNRFGPIRWLKKDSEIKIITSDNKEHFYIISETLTVKPSEVEVLSANTETLILYTCTGLFDSQRYIIKAIPKT
jgi:LPXTG-site transpeptidase (sortase) family protein